MSRVAPLLKIDSESRTELIKVFEDKSESRTRVDRCRIILGSADGVPVAELARQSNLTPNSVRNIRRRFEERGLSFLNDAPRSGRPCQYTEEDEKRILEKIDSPPPDGYSKWDGNTIAESLGISKDFVWAYLRKNGICLNRRRSWCVSTDPDFTAKAADIIGLYLNPPLNAFVISIDEKPGIQAISRTQGFVYGKNGKILRAYKSTYRRNGTLNLFAALNVASGSVFGKVTERKTRVDFLEFMDSLLLEYPQSKDMHFHVVLDNYCIHKKNTQWLEAHPNVTFHFTPTSASWLNQVEIWFGIMTRRTLRDGSFNSKEDLRQAIERYIENYSKDPKPFVWRKREVKGSQIHNTIKNLTN